MVDPRWRYRLLIRLCEAQAWRCAYCWSPLPYPALDRDSGDSRGHQATLDHFVPRCANGKTRYSNLIAACWSCNHDKGRGDAMTFHDLHRCQKLRTIHRQQEQRRAGLWRPNSNERTRMDWIRRSRFRSRRRAA